MEVTSSPFVELGLLDLEGELGGVVVGLEGLASQRNDLALLGVIRGQSIKELVLDLSAWSSWTL